jgi:hypothetical protein
MGVTHNVPDFPGSGRTGDHDLSDLGVKGSQVQILSARHCDVSGHRTGPGLRIVGPGSSCVRGGPGVGLWLLVAVGVDGEVAEEAGSSGSDPGALAIQRDAIGGDE